jgi:hypothetical protein
MGVIVNYWVILTPDITGDVGATANVQPPDQGSPGEVPQIIYGQSIDYPQLNFTRQDTRKMLRNFPERGHGTFPPGLWNCLVRADGLHALTAMREDMQRLQAAYPAEFQVGGCWDYDTGQPVGGVGSPWFDTPPGLVDMMPDGLQDIVLGAGQAKRVFV